MHYSSSDENLSMRCPSLIRRNFLLPVALSFLLVAGVAYWPSFFGERIWDDHFLVGSNPFFRSPALAWEAFRHWLYPFSTSSYYRPVQNLSYILDYCVWGEQLWGYHLTNVLLHVGAAVLLANVLRLLTFNRSSSQPHGESESAVGRATPWIVAGVWLVHPIHHAGVAYISGRADSLAALLALGAWLMVHCAMNATVRWKSGSLAATAAGLALLALCAKEVAFTWIFLCLLYYLCFCEGASRSSKLCLLLGCSVVTGAYAMLRFSLPDIAPSSGASIAFFSGFGDRLVLMAKALGDYVALTFWPANLHMERKLLVPAQGLAQLPWMNAFRYSLLLPIGVASVTAAIWLWCKHSPRCSIRRFAICWFSVGFLPISNLFPLNATVAEHWIYMPSAGLILLLVVEFTALRIRPAVQAAIIGVVAALLIYATHAQSRTWVNEERFIGTTIARGGDSARLRSNLARVLAARGDTAQAESVIHAAIHAFPDAAMLRIQLAEFAARRGEPGDAVRLLQSDALAETMPKGASPILGLRESYLVGFLAASGHDTEAQALLDESLRGFPSAWSLVRVKAALHVRDHQPELATASLRGYLARAWWHREARMFLADHLAKHGRLADAAEEYLVAAKLDIRATEPWEKIARMRAGASGGVPDQPGDPRP